MPRREGKLSDRTTSTCVAFWLPDACRGELEAIAEDVGTTTSALIRMAIARYLGQEPDLDEIRRIETTGITGVTHGGNTMGFWLPNETRKKLEAIANRVGGRVTLSLMIRLAIARYLEGEGSDRRGIA